jgi:hypothetical protein
MTDSRTYKFGESQLTLTFGDITTSEAQVLVSSDDCYLTMSGGVSAAIRRAGGTAIALDVFCFYTAIRMAAHGDNGGSTSTSFLKETWGELNRRKKYNQTAFSIFAFYTRGG